MAENSLLENYVLFAPHYSESEDPILIGSVLPVVAALLRLQRRASYSQRCLLR